MTNPVDVAVTRFSQPYSCSQAVLSAFASELGLSDEQATKLASPFGGGMALQGRVCGAVTAALMVIGLARGTSDPKDKEAAYRLGQEFMQRFEAQHDSVLCRELIGYNLSAPEEYQAAKKLEVFTKACPKFVRSAAKLVTALIEE